MTGYIPTSVPVSMMDGSGITQGNISCIDNKVEYVEDMEQGEQTSGCMPDGPRQPSLTWISTDRAWLPTVHRPALIFILYPTATPAVALRNGRLLLPTAPGDLKASVCGAG